MSEQDIIMTAYSEFLIHLGISALLAAMISTHIEAEINRYEENGMEAPDYIIVSQGKILTWLLFVPLLLFVAELMARL